MTKLHWLVFLIICLGIGTGITWLFTQQGQSGSPLTFAEDTSPVPTILPLQKYSIDQLKYTVSNSDVIEILEVLDEAEDFTAYQFVFQASGGRMTGQINIPATVSAQLSSDYPAILMVRGYVPPNICETGVGTKNAAAEFARSGFITVAPDFLSCGESDPEPADSWEARFIKPVQVLELLESIQSHGVPISEETTQRATLSKIGLWGHSNGGQIALSVLQALEQEIPTTLWAPVTAPFPYSVLFFSDEAEDEGKELRKWLSIFERDYDVFDFTVTKHLDKLHGSIQLHHGSADDAAPKIWSDEFVDKVVEENNRRDKIKSSLQPLASESATTTQDTRVIENQNDSLINLEKIDLTYYEYPGADHNLRPDWNTVVARDIDFFLMELAI